MARIMPVLMLLLVAPLGFAMESVLAQSTTNATTTTAIVSTTTQYISITYTTTITYTPPLASTIVIFGLGVVIGALIAGIAFVLKSGKAIQRGSGKTKARKR